MDNQAKDTKVLGITATPERDVDYVDMAEEWAEYFGYTDDEIDAHKHLAINMDLEEAIRLGYVINPKSKYECLLLEGKYKEAVKKYRFIHLKINALCRF